MAKVTIRGFATLATVLALFAYPTAGQHPSESVAVSVVNQPRPVAFALRQIEEQFGYIVTYEDTAYLHPADIVDLTDIVSRDPKRAKRILGMRSGTIVTTVRAPAGHRSTQVRSVLDDVLAVSRRNGNTGDFRVIEADGALHVVPISAKGENGSLVPYQSPLEVPVTLEGRDESALQFIHRFTDAVSYRSGRKIRVGVLPLGRFDRTRLRIDAFEETARTVAWRMLKEMGGDLTWQLLCSVGEKSSCALNIYPVRSS